MRYGDHLSPLLLEEPRKIAANMGFTIADSDSPYLDVNWKEPTRPISEEEILQAAEEHYAQQDAEDAAEEEAEREATVEAVRSAQQAIALLGDEDEDVNPYAD